MVYAAVIVVLGLLGCVIFKFSLVFFWIFLLALVAILIGWSL